MALKPYKLNFGLDKNAPDILQNILNGSISPSYSPSDTIENGYDFSQSNEQMGPPSPVNNESTPNQKLDLDALLLKMLSESYKEEPLPEPKNYDFGQAFQKGFEGTDTNNKKQDIIGGILGIINNFNDYANSAQGQRALSAFSDDPWKRESMGKKADALDAQSLAQKESILKRNQETKEKKADFVKSLLALKEQGFNRQEGYKAAAEKAEQDRALRQELATQNIESKGELQKNMQQFMGTQKELDRKNTEKLAKIYAGSRKSNQDTPKKIPASAASKIGEIKTALNSLSKLEEGINESTFSPSPIIGKARSLNPFDSTTQLLNQKRVLAKQIIGKGLEGGVLRKEDESKYEAILPGLNDTNKKSFQNKVNNLKSALENKYINEVQALEDAGYDVSKFKAPTKPQIQSSSKKLKFDKNGNLL